MKKEYLLLIGILIGVGIGLVAGYFAASQPQVCSKPQTPQAQPSQSQAINQTLINHSMEYINNYLLQPGITAKLLNVSVYSDSLYKLSLQFERENQIVGMSDVYLTRDGKTLVLQSVDLSKEPEVERTEVSADDDPYLGGENAKVTIIEFSDFACPFCAKFENEILPKILEKYGDKIKFVYRDFPVHENVSKLAAEAANCAGDQGKYWDYHKLLFEKQNEWVKPNESLVRQKLYSFAEQLNLNMDDFKACMDSDKYDKEIQKDYIDGAKAGVTGTPTIFINGIKIVGAQPVEEFYKIIDKELESSSQ